MKKASELYLEKKTTKVHITAEVNFIFLSIPDVEVYGKFVEVETKIELAQAMGETKNKDFIQLYTRVLRKLCQKHNITWSSKQKTNG